MPIMLYWKITLLNPKLLAFHINYYVNFSYKLLCECLFFKNEARDIESCVMWIHNSPCVTMCKCQVFYTLWSEFHVISCRINKTLVYNQICETRDFKINIFLFVKHFERKVLNFEVIWDGLSTSSFCF